MRILAITDSHPPYHHGGYELRCKAVLDRLQSRGHDIRIVTMQPPNGKLINSPEEHIYRVLHQIRGPEGMFRGVLNEYLDVRSLDSHLHSFKPDLVYLGHILNLSRAMFPYLAETGLPIVIDDGGITVSWAYTHRGPWYGLIGCQSAAKIKNWIKRLLRASVNQLSRDRLKTAWIWPENVSAFFNNPVALDRVLEEGICLQRANVIHSGVDTERFRFSDSRIQVREIEILVPGRIEPNKGTIDAVVLLDFVRRKNINAKMTIIGYAYSDYYNELLMRINERGLQQCVTIVPQVEYHDMPAYYQRADFCFFPSYQKVGLSRVPLEAMASGCVVITYGNEGSGQIIQHSDTGYIVPESGIDSAAEIICGLVAAPAMRRMVIHHARKVIEQHHSMDRYVDEIEAFLFEAVSRNQS